MENLWGELELKPITMPKHILDAQGKYLSEKTNSKIYGLTTCLYDPKCIMYSFDIVCKNLDYFKIGGIITIKHGLEKIYPVEVSSKYLGANTIECFCESSYIETIKEILSMHELHTMIRNIYSMSS